MLKVIKLFFLLFVLILIFNKQLISYYFSYKFSKWTERELVFDKFDIDYPNKIENKIIINIACDSENPL